MTSRETKITCLPGRRVSILLCSHPQSSRIIRVKEIASSSFTVQARLAPSEMSPSRGVKIHSIQVGKQCLGRIDLKPRAAIPKGTGRKRGISSLSSKQVDSQSSSKRWASLFLILLGAIAIGAIAIGVFAVGTFAVDIFAVGPFAVGITAVGDTFIGFIIDVVATRVAFVVKYPYGYRHGYFLGFSAGAKGS
ncbi:hypothetical protein GGS21DRAFT_410067 [Xylaria nigripes]|nr:hypothetical protein GGS21DRAFT_410067 [Xylaria nigripes]